MQKNKKKDNSLIKHIHLKKEIYKTGIKRINKKTLEYLEKILKEIIKDKLTKLSRHLIIKGKKTLEKEDIKDILIESGGEETISYEI